MVQEENRKFPWLTAQTENDQLLIEKLHSICQPFTHKGFIQYYLKGEKVGEIALPNWTTMEARHILAELAQVKEYDDFWLIDDNKTVKASEVFVDGLAMSLTAEDRGNINQGEYEGIKYQFYKNYVTCECCGRNNYKAIYPEQKELIEKLYRK